VQQGKHHIDLAEGPRGLSRLRNDQVVPSRVGAQGYGTGGRIDRGDVSRGQGQPFRLVRLEDPLSVDADADRDDVVGILVDHREDARRGGARNGVLTRPTTEDDSDAGLAVRAHWRPA
jgi:hypothetical protein